VALATYNGARYLPELLASLAGQERPPDELVIGDDGSSDETLRILHDFAENAAFPVQVATNAERLGYADNFLCIAARCAGDVICFCDQDDIWLASKLSRVEEAFGSAPAPILVAHYGDVVNASGQPLGRRFPRGDVEGGFCPPHAPEAHFPGFAISIRSDLLSVTDRATRPKDGDPRAELLGHDTWTWLLASCVGTILVLPEALVSYRQHQNLFGDLHISPRVVLTRAAETGNETYRRRAERSREFGQYLLSVSAQWSLDDHQEWAESAQIRAQVQFALADAYGRRADVYASQTKRQASAAFWSLLKDGVYERLAGSRSAALKSACKDTASILFRSFPVNESPHGARPINSCEGAVPKGLTVPAWRRPSVRRPPGGDRQTSLRLLMLGASSGDTCGVRDYAGVMEQQLREQGNAVETVWWNRHDASSAAASWRELGRWLEEVDSAAAGRDGWHPDLVLCHYSVFTWSHRGLPIFAPRLARRLARLNLPVVSLLHEFAYPLGRHGWRGTLWVVSQRAALVPMMRSAQGVAVMTDERAAWLTARVWLPHRPTVVVPVWSNLPPSSDLVGPRTGFTVGVFGYGTEDFDPSVVMGAVAELVRGPEPVRLVLLGAPGSRSAQGLRWSRAADEAGCGAALSFTGVLELKRLSASLSAVDVVLFPDVNGPTSRKTTLAAALAAAKPVVALDGPQRWEALAEQGAVRLVTNSQQMAEQLRLLLADPVLRAAQGRAAGAFYERMMSPSASLARLQEFFQVPLLAGSVGSKGVIR
jgi:glycosyltransferase involved in cell wall biosynthesis